MKYLKYILPNALTLLNLSCGIIAILHITNGNVMTAIYLLLIAALADLLDGLTAKILKATSDFGKQLDSLSDLVSFGVAPSFILFVMIQASVGIDGNQPLFGSHSLGIQLLLLSGFLVALFSALRLARFNIQTTTGTDFCGLPVPANTLIIISLYISAYVTKSPLAGKFVSNPWLLLVLVLVLSLLLVSRIPMLSLKFSNLNVKENVWKYILIFGAVLLFVLSGTASLFYIMLFYIILSIIKFISGGFKIL